MRQRLRVLGFALALIGVGFLVGGGVAFAMTKDGYDSYQSLSEAHDVTLSYNDDGQLIDRGSTEQAEAIMQLLTDDWSYPVVESHFDPADPLVNTHSEYMYQMATVAYHVLYSTQTVVLEETVEYNGEVFEAGVYEFEVDGRYWTDFDRAHPIEGPARDMAWSGTVHGLFGELGVGTLTHNTLQMGLALAGLLAGVGATLVLAGAGMVWVSRGQVALVIDHKEFAAAAPKESVTV
jgi:hypothetical protein